MNHQDYFSRHSEFTTHQAGEVIFSLGDEGNSKMYAVKSGKVDIVFEGKLLETVEQGAFFGEMSLVDSEPRSATAICQTDCEIVEVDKYHFLYLTHEAPMFALTVMHVMADRIRKLHKFIE